VLAFRLAVIDSSAWLEYFAGGPNAEAFATPIEDLSHRLVPTLTLFEVFKRLLLQVGEAQALRAVATMRAAEVVELDADIAVEAARLSAQAGLAMADAVVLATARTRGAELWTQDADFAGLPDVRYFPKRPVAVG
jgi:predicted nucleic acid-binding protein